MANKKILLQTAHLSPAQRRTEGRPCNGLPGIEAEEQDEEEEEEASMRKRGKAGAGGNISSLPFSLFPPPPSPPRSFFISLASARALSLSPSLPSSLSLMSPCLLTWFQLCRKYAHTHTRTHEHRHTRNTLLLIRSNYCVLPSPSLVLSTCLRSRRMWITRETVSIHNTVSLRRILPCPFGDNGRSTTSQK
jgi:hypothetical protein